MAGQTPRFGLNFFGGDTDGSFSDDTDKFTSEDRLTLDTILAALEKHNHRVPTSLTEPAATPTLAYATTGGALDGGTTYYYVVSFVDSAGLETVAGPEASITTPDILPAPTLPQGDTSTGTGALTAGLYYYALTGLRADEESALGAIATVTVLEGENTVTFDLPALGEATSYQLWRQKSTDPSWTRVVTSSTGTAVDDGSVSAAVFGDPANTPPSSNTGVDTYTITITLTGADTTTVQDSAGWRIYRSTTSGQYSSAALVAEVIERTSDTDPTTPLLTSWVDDGDAPLTGSPLTVSSQLQIPAYTFEYASSLPAASAYPNHYPILDSSLTLYVANAGTWTAIGGGGGGGGGSSRGLAFMGTWDSATTYLSNDVVVYNDGFWQATGTPVTGTAPGAVAPPVMTLPATNPTFGLTGGLLNTFTVSTATTVAGFDWWNSGTDTNAGHPFGWRLADSDNHAITGPYIFDLQVDPSAISSGWVHQEIGFALPLATGTTYSLIAYSGVVDAITADVGTVATGIAATGAYQPTGDLYYHTSGSNYTQYTNGNIPIQWYGDATVATWTQIATFGGSGSTQRGVATFTGYGEPTTAPTGSQPGDLYVDLADGSVHQL